MSDTTKDIKADELKKNAIDSIALEKTEKPQLNIVNIAKSWIEENITENQRKFNRELVMDIYNELADTYTDHKSELKKIARLNNPYLITDLSHFDEYIRNYDEKNNFNCRIFPKSNFDDLIFAPGNIGFIGARTSRGKTTALASVAMDAIKQGKRVLFASMEESHVQITKRLIAYLLFENGYYPDNKELQDKMNLETWKKSLRETKFDAKKTVIKLLHGDAIGDIFNDSTMTKKFCENIRIAKDTLDNLMKSGKLAIFNGIESNNFEQLLDVMGDNDPGTICLFDYVQKSKPLSNYTDDGNNRFAFLQKISNELANVTKRTNIITICGAQFGRTNEKAKSNVLDLFTDESFQECSAIEQVGEIEIGIGRHFRNGTRHAYYAILKDRDNGEYDPSIYYELDPILNFSKFAPKRREEEKDGKKYNNLIQYYNQDKDEIDGETPDERRKRIYGEKGYTPQGKGQKQTKTQKSNTIKAGKAILTEGGW